MLHEVREEEHQKRSYCVEYQQRHRRPYQGPYEESEREFRSEQRRLLHFEVGLMSSNKPDEVPGKLFDQQSIQPMFPVSKVVKTSRINNRSNNPRLHTNQ